YNVTMYIMAGLLVIGFLCNLFIKAVHQRFYMQADHDAEMAQMTVGAAGALGGTILLKHERTSGTSHSPPVRGWVCGWVPPTPPAGEARMLCFELLLMT